MTAGALERLVRIVVEMDDETFLKSIDWDALDRELRKQGLCVHDYWMARMRRLQEKKDDRRTDRDAAR